MLKKQMELCQAMPKEGKVEIFESKTTVKGIKENQVMVQQTGKMPDRYLYIIELYAS
jgi:hypothetical protein